MNAVAGINVVVIKTIFTISISTKIILFVCTSRWKNIIILYGNKKINCFMVFVTQVALVISGSFYMQICLFILETVGKKVNFLEQRGKPVHKFNLDNTMPAN